MDPHVDKPEFVPVQHDLAASVFETYDEGDPRFCGYRWWLNLLQRDRYMPYLIAQTVPGREDYWGDYSDAAAYLDGWDLASGVDPTDRDDVCRMHFTQLPEDEVPESDGAFVHKGGVTEGRFMNLLRCSDGVWRVWSLGALDLAEVPDAV